MIVLDTHVLVFHALAPERLSRRAASAINRGLEDGSLACSDISLWEIAMLIAKGRLDPGADSNVFLTRLTQALAVSVMPITAEIAVLAQADEFQHGDPADRIIAATALAHRAKLVTADEKLHGLKTLPVVW